MDDSDGADGDAPVDPWADDADDDWVAEASDRAAPAADAAADDAHEAATGSAAAAAADADDDGNAAAGTARLGRRRYRVLARDGDAFVFVDLDTPDPGPGPAPDEGFEPVRVAAAVDGDDTDDDLAETVDGLEPGTVVTARLRWPDPDGDDAGDRGGEAADAGTPLARVESLAVDRESRYLFADGVEPMFEAARDAWQDARAAGEAMGSRVTRDTDGEPNGALYVFAETGARDLLGEFRSGTTPLEPLVDRVNDDLADDDPRSVFVLRPAEGGYVVVYIAFRRDGVLARTVRDTYF